ncbi:MAG: hypothetical protein U1F41_07305 [Burkholderiales bacterium]
MSHLAGLRRPLALIAAAILLGPAHASAATNAEAGAAIIARAVEGIGGAEVLDRIGTISVEGESTRLTPQGTIKTPTRSYVEFPASYRQEIEINGSMVAMASSTEGAFLIAGKAVQPLSEAQRQNIEVTVLRTPLVLLKTRRNPLFSADRDGSGKVGEYEVDFAQVYVGNEVMRIAVDKATGRIVQEEFDTRGGVPERAGRMVVTFSDFRKLPNGLTVAHASTGRFEGEVAFANRIASIRFNEKFAEGTFGPVTQPTSGRPSPVER